MKTLLSTIAFTLIVSGAFCQQKEQVHKTVPQQQQTQKAEPAQKIQSPATVQTHQTTEKVNKTQNNVKTSTKIKNQQTKTTAKYQYECSQCGYISPDPGTCPRDGSTLIPRKISNTPQ